MDSSGDPTSPRYDQIHTTNNNSNNNNNNNNNNTVAVAGGEAGQGLAPGPVKVVVSLACCCFLHTLSSQPTTTTPTSTPVLTCYPCVSVCHHMYPTPTLLLPLWGEYEGSNDLSYFFGLEGEGEDEGEV